MRKNCLGRVNIIKILTSSSVGFINGFFGGGGGLLAVIAFRKIYKMDTRSSHATTLAVIFPISIVSSLVYIATQPFVFTDVVFISIGVLIGGTIGALLLSKLNSKFISWVFIVVVFSVGVKMIV